MREKPQRRCLHDFIGKKAFAIISRSAKKPRKLYFGIKSSQIICDRWLGQNTLFSFGKEQHTHLDHIPDRRLSPSGCLHTAYRTHRSSPSSHLLSLYLPFF